MKKIIALALAVMMMTAIISCGKKDDDKTTDPNTSTAPQTEVYNVSASEVVNALISIPALEGKVARPVEPGLLNGFDNAEIKDFAEGVMFAPMIGSIPFIGYVFKLNDASGAQAFVNNLKSNANMRWNICTEADTMIAETKGNFVLFVMLAIDPEFGPTENDVTAIKNAFAEAVK